MTKAEPKAYGAYHNCSTLVLKPLWSRGIFWSMVAVSVSASIALALQPPEFLIKISNLLFPGHDVDKTPLFEKFGFAAGIQGVPFELEEEQLATDNLPKVHEEERTLEALKSEDSLKGLIAEINLLQNTVRGFDLATLDDEDIQEVAERTFAREMEKVQDSIDPMVQILDVPPYVKYTWAQVVDAIHEGLSFLRQNELISSFIAKLKVSAANIAEFIIPVLEMLSRVLHLAWKVSEHYFNKLFSAVCALMDYVWGLKASKRVKTVWGLTGIHKTGVVGAAMRLALATQFAELEGRTTFLNDYSKFCEMLKDFAKQENIGYRNRVGGPQRRPVKYSKPLMSKGEAELLGFKPGEYVTEKEYQERVDSYLEFGTAQGADGVFLADKNPELIAKSQHRYEPKYADLSPADRLLAEEIAQALVDQYPHVYKDCQVVPMKSVQAYIKPKYSPGAPFIGDRGFKTRQAMFDAGYDKVLRKAATEYLQSGKYPVQFYHAFVKSQVVDIKKCLPVSMGGKDKDVRTVVSQDMFTYFMDQCFQIERNKRRVWDTFGAGIGMPLNQSMEQIFSEMRDLQKERGGRYIIADGTAFDSYCKPFLTEVNYHLWRYGFKDHPSGNGEAIASVLKASYDARQNAWIIGITEPEYDKLIISVPDHDTRKMIEHRNPKNVVPLADFIDFSVFNKLNHQQQLDYVKNLELPGGKVLVSWRSDLRPKNANWMGEFRFDPNPSTNTDVLQYQTFKYTPDNFEGMYQDIKALGEGDIKLLSNVHAKNRGGSTGGSDTSNLNTNMFKAGIIRAWCLTMNRPPKEFFKYNSLKNTSDDTIWQTGGQFGLNTIEQVEQFKHHAAEVGIHLTIETTKDISQVEYLSKFVRVPTAEDSAALKIWRQHKIRSIQQAHKAMGYTVPTTFEELNNPRFVVVQNPTAILLRRSAFRYYQSNARTWRYVSIERGAGHAQNTAFVPELYAKFAKEWCDDVNNLLVEHGIHRKFRYHPGDKDSNLLPFVEQVDPRASQQALSPRQQAFLNWLKGNMYPSYLKVLNVHMNVQSPDPLYHEKLLRKLSRGWRGWSEIMAEGVDGLFAATDSIPDEWSKKFNGQIEMLYAEVPFYTRNKYIEKYVYLKMLEHSTPEELTYSDFTSVLAEGPYAGACDAHHFWETIRNKEECEKLLEEDVTKYQGLVMFISALYAFLSPIEWAIMGVPFLGSLYKLYVWNFVGLNKVYGIMNTLYWHSTGRSSREISRIQPRDPYIVSKQFCAFLVDFLPPQAGYLMTFPIILLSLLPKLLEAISKAWYVGGEIKQDKGHTPNSQTENLWSRYSDDYVEKLRASPTRKAYIAAETGTGKSTWWIAALWAARHRQKIRKIWLVEPRKILRDETIIPFGIPSQKLKKGVEASVSTDVYICTYGHLQSRLHDMDPEHDIVLFDEFHELQGEMILGLHTVKAPIFLLSATPVDIPALEGSPFLTPEIKRRFPTVIHECDDGLSPLDMFMMAKNKYPELCDRALIIVPTLKEVDKLYNSLEYLRVGKISKLSSKDRKPAEEGIIISTPYVQAGFDLKPPPKILIDSGRDVVVDQGVLVRPFPWTSKDVNKQRAGRVSRLQPGVIYRPKKAGTGQRPIQYPSPELFRHKVVAEHFKVPQLCPVPRPEITEMPYFMIDHSKISKISIRKSVAMVHAIALSGVREDQLETFYNRRVRGFAFDEDHEFLNRVYNNPRWSKVPLIPWDEVKYHYHRQNVTFYAFGNEHDPTIRAMGPIKAVKGQWVEMLADVPPEEVKPVDREEVTAFFDNLASRFSRVQNTIVKHLDSMSHELASQVAAI